MEATPNPHSLKAACLNGLFAFPKLYYQQTFDNQFKMFTHRHNLVEIMYAVNGSFTIVFPKDRNSKSATVRTDDFIIINSAVPHRVVSPEKPVKVMNIEFQLTENEHFAADLRSLYTHSQIFRDFIDLEWDYAHIRDPQIILPILKKIHSLLNLDTGNGQDRTSQLLLQAHATEFFIECARLSLTSSTQKGTFYIQQALNYINDHVHEDMKVLDIARHVNLNATYLETIFKKHTQTTLVNYINKQRIIKSLSYLSGTRLSIVEIALLAGFNNRQHFTRVFNQIMEVSPGEYRRLADSEEYNYNLVQTENPLTRSEAIHYKKKGLSKMKPAHFGIYHVEPCLHKEYFYESLGFDYMDRYIINCWWDEQVCLDAIRACGEAGKSCWVSLSSQVFDVTNHSGVIDVNDDSGKVFEPVVTVKPDWRERIDHIAGAVRSSGGWNAFCGFYLDEPMLWGVTPEQIKEVSGYARARYPDKGFFICFSIAEVAPDIWTTGKVAVITEDAGQYLTDVAFDMYHRFDEKYEYIATQMKNRLGNRSDLKIWYVPCTMNYRGDKDEQHCLDHLRGCYELLRREENPGGLFCYSYHTFSSGEEDLGNVGLNHLYDPEYPDYWPALKKEIETIGRELIVR